MKKYTAMVDLEVANQILVKACDDFIEKKIKEKKESKSWVPSSFLGGSSIQNVNNLKAKLNQQTSIQQLICTIKECKQDKKFSNQLRELVVTEIYQTPKEVINCLGQDIARQALVAASRGFSPGINTNPAPNVGAAIDQLFIDYWRAAKSAPPTASIELIAKG